MHNMNLKKPKETAGANLAGKWHVYCFASLQVYLPCRSSCLSSVSKQSRKAKLHPFPRSKLPAFFINWWQKPGVCNTASVGRVFQELWEASEIFGFDPTLTTPNHHQQCLHQRMQQMHKYRLTKKMTGYFQEKGISSDQRANFVWNDCLLMWRHPTKNRTVHTPLDV